MAVVIIGLLGISLLFPALGARFEAWINQVLQPLQNKLQGQGECKRDHLKKENSITP
jgi:hypothetical protein